MNASRQRYGRPKPWAHLYKTAAWQRLRMHTFNRDHWTCTRCDTLCHAKAPHPRSPVCDHIQPHKGDEALFSEPANLTTLCKSCHDGAKQREEKGHRLERSDGW